MSISLGYVVIMRIVWQTSVCLGTQHSTEFCFNFSHDTTFTYTGDLVTKVQIFVSSSSNTKETKPILNPDYAHSKDREHWNLLAQWHCCVEHECSVYIKWKYVCNYKSAFGLWKEIVRLQMNYETNERNERHAFNVVDKGKSEQI